MENATISEQLKETQQAHLASTQAKSILKDIGNISSNVDVFSKRWVCELIQNAIDTAHSLEKKDLEITIEKNDNNEIIFSHNGGYFKMFDLLALLQGGSSKDFNQESSDIVGHFGSGFLVSHILSRKVQVSGTVKDKNKEVFYDFEVLMDRSSSNENDIRTNIEHNFTNIDTDAKDNEGTIQKTCFIYKEVTQDGLDAYKKGVEFLSKHIPYIMAFNNIKVFTIDGEIFSKDTVCKNMHIQENEDVILAIPTEYSIESDLSKVFIAVPIVETANYIHIPFVINSKKLKTIEARNTLSSDKTELQSNIELLEKAFSLYFNFIKDKMQTCSNAYEFMKFQLVMGDRAKEPVWEKFNNIVKDTLDKIKDLKVVPLHDTEQKQSILDCIFPILMYDSKDLTNYKNDIFAQFYELVNTIKNDIPAKEKLHEWKEVASNIAGCLDGIITTYTIDNLISDFKGVVETYTKKNKNSLPKFDEAIFSEKSLPLSKDLLLKYYELNNFLHQKNFQVSNSIDNLIPSEAECLGGKNRQWTKSGIGFQIKLKGKNLEVDSIGTHLSKLGKYLISELIHPDFVRFEVAQAALNNEYLTLEGIFQHLKDEKYYYLPEKITYEWLKPENENYKKLIGWLGLFNWCIKNNKLFEGIYMLMNDLSIRKWKETDKTEVILPFSALAINTKYEKLYENRVLHNLYFKLEDEVTELNDFSTHDAFITELPYKIPETNLDKEKLRALITSSKTDLSNSHKINTQTSEYVYDVPFWNETVGKTGTNIELSQLFFEFIIEVLAKNKPKEIEVACDCKDKKHTIVPVKWLSQIKVSSWVAVKKEEGDTEKIQAQDANKSTLPALFLDSKDKTFNGLIIQHLKNDVSFLKHFDFDLFDISAKIKAQASNGNISEDTIRDNTSKLIDLMDTDDIENISSINPDKNDAFKDYLRAGIEKYSKNNTKQAENNAIGKYVESVIEQIVTEKGFKIEYTGIGSDYELSDNSQTTSLHSAKINSYLLEIKFTIGNRVHLSKVQGKEAQKNKKEYIVVVVKCTEAERKKILECATRNTPINDNITNTVKKNTYIIVNVDQKLPSVTNDSNDIETDMNGYWLKESLWKNTNCASIENWLKNI